MKSFLRVILSSILLNTAINYTNAQIQTNNLQLWLKADQGVTITDTVISHWADQSGNDRNAYQEISSNSPTLTNNSINFYPTISMDGFNDILFMDSSIIIGSVFMIAKWKKGEELFPTYGGLITSQSGGTNEIVLIAKPNTTNFYNGYFGSNVEINRQQTSDFSPIDQYKLIYGEKTSPSEFANLVFGRNRSLNYYWEGDILEILIYDTILSETEQTEIENYLRSKYAPPVDLNDSLNVDYGFGDTVISAFAERYTSYLWSNGSTDSSITVDSAGTYFITVTDIFNYQSSDSIIVTYPDFHRINDTTICLYDTIIWDPDLGGNYSYQWSTGETTSSIDISREGTYTVTITDTLGNSWSPEPVQVAVDSFPEQNSLGLPRDICKYESISLVQQGPDIQEWEWSSGSTDDYVNVDTTFYWLKITNARGCLDSVSNTYNIVGVAPNVFFNSDTVCLNDSTFFYNYTTIESGYNIDSVLWDFGDGDRSKLWEPRHLYNLADTFLVSLTVYSEGGCSSFYEKAVIVKEIPEAKFEVIYGNAQCSGVPVNFLDKSNTITPYAGYNWDFDTGETSFEQNPSYVFPGSNIYNVQLEVTSDEGCSDSINEEVVVSDELPLPQSFLLITPTDSAYIIGNSTVEFNWNKSQNAFTYKFEIAKDTQFVTNYHFEYTDSLFVDINISDIGTWYYRVTSYNLCNDSLVLPYQSLTVIDPGSSQNLQLWLKADQGVTITDTVISHWADQSGNDRNAYQEISSNSPTLTNNSINFHPTVSMDGFNDILFMDSSIIIGSVFMIAKWKKGEELFPTYGGLITSQSGGANEIVLIAKPNTTNFYNGYFGSNVEINRQQTSDFSPIDQYKLIYGEKTSPSEFANLVFGRNRSLNYYWEGDILEILIYDTILSETEQTEIENYLRSKYAPPVDLNDSLNVDYGFGDTVISAFAERYTSYLWSNGSTDSSITVDSAGTYFITVTDIFNYQSSDSIIVTYPDFHRINDTTICLYDTIIWDPDLGGNYSYQWSTGETTEAIDISREGTYTVTITDTLGNSWSPEPVQVAVDSFPATASLGADTTLCSGNRLELAHGQNEAVDFLWSDGSTGNYYLIGEPEQVAVQVTNTRSCVAYDTININVAGKAPTADFAFDKLCRDIAVQFQDISTAYNGASLVDYQWDFSGQGTSQEANPQFIFTDTGQVAVSLSVLTNEGCHNDTTHHLQIHELPKAAFSPKQVCENATVQLANFSTSANGDIVSYNWTIDGENFATETPEYTFSAAGQSNVQLIITTEYNCPDTLTDQITVKPAPQAVFSFDTACLSEVVHFSNQSTGNLGQQLASFWRFGEENTSTNQHPVYTFTETGSQTVQLVVTQLADGCHDTAIHSFRVHHLPEAQLNLQTGCENDTINLQQSTNWGEGEFPGTILWAVGDTAFYGESPVYSEDEAGVYPVHITIKNAAGCEDTTSGNLIINPNPEVEFSALPDTIFVPSEITLDNISDDADYLWLVNQNTFSTLLNPTFNFDSAGMYIFTLAGTNEDGCTSTYSDTTQALEPYIDGAILECRAIIDQGRLYVSADLANAGTKSIANPELRLTLSTGQMFAEVFSGTLYAGQQETYSFRSQYFLENDVSLEWIIVELIYEADQAQTNNSCTYVFGETSEIFAPYPNPAGSTINIDFTALENGSAKLILYNLMGEIVLHETHDVSIGLNRLQIPNPSRGSGVHTLQIEVNGNRKTFRVVL